MPLEARGHADEHCTGDITSPSEPSQVQAAVLSQLLQAAGRAAMTVRLQRIPVKFRAEKLSERLTENNTSMEGRRRVASGSRGSQVLVPCNASGSGDGGPRRRLIWSTR